MNNDDRPLGIPTTPIFIVCVCCSRNRPATDAFPVAGRPGRYMCGNCDAGEQPGCPRCNPPEFFGPLAN